MFNPSRDQVRSFFIDTWRKARAKEVLTPMETIAADIIALHPEYHTVVEDPEAVHRDFPTEAGQINPFLHLSLHLAIEDRMLYPALAGASDPQVAAVGKRFQHEMGGLAAAYEDFARRWDGATRIAAAPGPFGREAVALLDALHARIRHEDRELLPLAESL